MHPSDLQLLLDRVHQITGLRHQLQGEYATISVEVLKDFVLGKLLVLPGIPEPTMAKPPKTLPTPKPTVVKSTKPTVVKSTQGRRSTPPPPEYLEACRRIMQAVKKYGRRGVKIVRIVDASGYSQVDTTKMVVKLVEEGQLIKAGKGPGTHYMIPKATEKPIRVVTDSPSASEPTAKELLRREVRRQLAKGPLSAIQLHAAIACGTYHDMYRELQKMPDVRTEGAHEARRYSLREQTAPTPKLTLAGELAVQIQKLLIEQGTEGLDRSQIQDKLGRPPQRGGVVMNAIRDLIKEGLVTVRKQGIRFIYQSKGPTVAMKPPTATPQPKPSTTPHKYDQEIAQCVKGMPSGITSRELRKRFPSVPPDILRKILLGLVQAGVVTTKGNTQGMRYLPL